MGAILMAIIMVGAISLIYSAFSISLSERTKQMGLLKSIGATKKQIRHSVVFEACVLCMVGILWESRRDLEGSEYASWNFRIAT